MKSHVKSCLGIPLLVMLLAVSCDDGWGQGEGLVITATVDPASVIAGSTVQVSCSIIEGDVSAPVPDATIEVTPADGVTIDGLSIVTSRSGGFEVTCRSASLPLAESESAAFIVTAGDPAGTVATVFPENVSAGESATVDCDVVDAFGNVVTGFESLPEGSGALEVEGFTVSSETAGAWEVFCSAPAEFPDCEKSPAILQVSPGRPIGLEMKLNPDKENYALKAAIKVSWIVTDAWGNVVSDLPADIVISPTEGLTLSGNTLTVKQEGNWTVTVALRDFELSDSDQVKCDLSAPELQIDWPPRGETVEGSPEVEVRGTVIDAANSNVTLKINKEVIAIGADGRFSMPMTAKHGLNGLLFSVKDSQGFEYSTTRGFYYSDSWTPVDGETLMSDVVRDDGAMLFLGQSFLDDGDHDRTHPNDLATLIEILLSSNVGGLLDSLPPISVPIPNIVNFGILGVQLQGDLEVEVQFRDVSFGDPYVEIRTRDGGVATSVTLQPVHIGLDLKFTIKARAIAFGNTYELLDPSSSSGSSMEIGTFGLGVSLNINKTPDTDLTVEGDDFELTIDDIQLDPIEHLEIDLGTIGALGIDLGTIDLTRIVGSIDDLLMNWVLEPILNFLTPLLTDLLEPLVVELMGTVLEALFDQLNLQQPVEIPAIVSGGTPVTMDLSLAPSTIVFTTSGGTVGLELGFLTAHKVDHDPIGVIGSLTDIQSNAFAFDPEPGVQAAIDIKTVNTLLFMLWQSGWITGKIDLSGLVGDVGFGVGNLKITPDLYLPPIINDGAVVGDDGMMALEIGDAFLKVQVDILGNPQFFDLWLQMAVQVQIVAEGSNVGIRFGKVTFFQTEFVNKGDLGDLFDMFLPSIPDLVRSIEGQEFAFPIPEIDLGSIIPGIEPGTIVQLGNGVSDVREGMVVLGADLL
ncbi:MAG TPA: hypothetical protein PKK50_01175 [Myxococcota bacterium]|nr:hypothetical protein [Myxococcota bacterium]HNZ02731.1 hypothetical protein [Myxococcota bacterium]